MDGIPIFICDERSVFAASDYTSADTRQDGSNRDDTAVRRVSALKRIDQRVTGYLDSFYSNSKRPFYPDVIAIATRGKPSVRVLVVGSGGRPYSHPDANVVCTDVIFAPHVVAIVDAHDLPFTAGSFDLVVAVAVLEHVADPQRCVAEMRRILVDDGIVFAVTPFLQPVHMGAHDFTRFTPMGHRRLFRDFDTIDEGVAMGAGSMLAFAISGFLVSLSRRRLYRNAAGLAGRLLTVPLRKLDRWLSPVVSRDNAAGCYFIGRRRATPIPDRVLIDQYKGGFDSSGPG
ncbi:MAG: class I SAM-dependent methyltransferase [Acetobacteraceae bacterium]